MAPSYWIARRRADGSAQQGVGTRASTGVGIRPLVPGLLQQRLVFNSGAAFSMLEGNANVLGLVSLGVAAGLVVGFNQWSNGALASPWPVSSRWSHRRIDRWRLGRVVDFLEFVPITFPIFNLADVAINLAVLCLALSLLPGWRRR